MRRAWWRRSGGCPGGHGRGRAATADGDLGFELGVLGLECLHSLRGRFQSLDRAHQNIIRLTATLFREPIPTHRRDQFIFGHAPWVNGVQRHEGYV